MKNIIDIHYYDFRYVLSNKNFRVSYIGFGNNFQNEIFGYYSYTFNNLERLKNLIIEIEEVIISGQEKNGLPGGEEAYINANSKYLELVITLPGYEEPFFVETQIFIKILNEYKNWLAKVENCEIPGLIPESRLDSWSCVPNKYIKEEYWQKKKKDEMNK